MQPTTSHWNEFWYQAVKTVFQVFLLALLLLSLLETLVPDFVRTYLSLDLFLYGSLVSGVVTVLLSLTTRTPLNTKVRPTPRSHVLRLSTKVAVLLFAGLAGGFAYLQVRSLGILGMLFSFALVLFLGILGLQFLSADGEDL